MKSKAADEAKTREVTLDEAESNVAKYKRFDQEITQRIEAADDLWYKMTPRERVEARAELSETAQMKDLLWRCMSFLGEADDDFVVDELVEEIDALIGPRENRD